jgi:hypothetical protein
MNQTFFLENELERGKRSEESMIHHFQAIQAAQHQQVIPKLKILTPL